MNCIICGKEISRIGSSCRLIEGKHLCTKCCFSVSSGEPDMIEKMKSEYRYYKEDLLRICAKCIQERESLVLLKKGEETPLKDESASEPIDEPATKEIPDIDGSLDQIIISSSTKEEILDNLKCLIEECLNKLEEGEHNEVRELFLKAKENLEARSINETMRLIKEAANIISEEELD